MMGRKELYPFFIIGYYMSTLCGWTTLTILVFAVIFALFYMRFTSSPDESSEGLDIDFKALMKVDSSKSDLTIKDHNWEDDTFLQDFPNNEVKAGFLTAIASDYLKPSEID